MVRCKLHIFSPPSQYLELQVTDVQGLLFFFPSTTYYSRHLISDY